MTSNDCGEKIAKVDCLINDSLVLYDHYIISVNVAIKKEQDYLIERVNYRIGVIDVELTRCFLVLYHSANYHYCCAMFHASPGFFAILAAIWGVFKFVYEGVKWIVEILHIRDIIKAAEILSTIWPAFRQKMSEIYGVISEQSQKLGMGIDGLSHLMNSVQGGLNVVGGLTGKSYEWLSVAGVDSSLSALKTLSDYASSIEHNPADLFDTVFGKENQKTRVEVQSWWSDTAKWISNTSEHALNGIKLANNAIDDILELKNDLPKFVIDHIPQKLIEGLEWVDSQIDNTLLPAVSDINKNLQQVNDLLDQYRDKTGVILENINNPGDLLLRMDNLEEKARKIQEQRIDDAAGRLLASQADAIEKDDTDVIKELESISQLLETEVVTPIFMTIEDVPRGTLPEIVAEPFETWFVGDY